ncbi:MAG: galactokinase [Streptomycetaceae bacterium]|nr:MAG: galactokinase [Streptomycetaceae bacterium]
MSKIDKEFVKTFGQTPDVIAAAPGRVNLIGEHIDYSDGYVLPFAIADRTYAALRKRPDRLVRIASAQRRKTIVTLNLDEINPTVKGQWERYVLGVIWAMGINEGVDVMIDGHVPLGAGLSSSAALECSVATALNDLFSLGFDLETLARLTQKAENQYVGVPCGIMDQSVSLMAKTGSALLLDCRDLTSRHVVFDVASSGLELLIIDTQAHHSLTDGGYAERRASCDSVVAKLGIRSMRELTLEKLENSKDAITATEFIRARHAVSEIARVIDAVAALEAKNFQELGLLLNASHESLRDDYDVSCPELNAAVNASLSAGALGARMVGGGFGGSAIALIKASQTQEVIKAIEIEFKKNSFKAPRFFTSLPSQGAEIIQRGL